MNKTTSVTGLNPARDYAEKGQNATWILLESYKAAFYEVIMAQLGLIGKAVFYDEYMYSQYGKNGTTAVANEGNYGIPTEAGGSFEPNMLLNFLTGYFKCNNVDITGHINATSGTFAGFINIPFKGVSQYCSVDSKGKYHLADNFNLYNDVYMYDCFIKLDTDDKYDGITLNIYTRPRLSKMDSPLILEGNIYHPKSKDSNGLFKPVSSILSESGGFMQLLNIMGNWFVAIDAMAEVTFNVL